MKFHEYITQRRAFGRTPWLRALLIWGLSGGLIVAGVWILVERDWWGLAPLLVGVGVRCIMGFGTKKNWKEDKAREEKGPNNKHRSDVLEEADPVRWKTDGSPLMELHIWYAAVNDISWDEAAQRLAHLSVLSDLQLRDIREAHAKYLLHPKFDKFLRK